MEPRPAVTAADQRRRFEAIIRADPGLMRLLGVLRELPLPLRAVVPLRHNGGWGARDSEGHSLPLSSRFARGWHLAALSGGHPLALFGEWDGRHLLPLSVWVEGRFCLLTSGET